MTTQCIPTLLGELHVVDVGSGVPLLLLPSLLTDHTLYDGLVAELGDGYRTIAVDPPGQGRSAHLTRCFTFDESARAYVDVLDALDLPDAVVVGNSWGAMVGGTMAARHPERIRALVLLNGTGSPGPRSARVEMTVLARLVRMLGRWFLLNRLVVPRFLGVTTRRTRPGLVAGLEAMVRRNDPRSASFAVESIVGRRPDQHELLGRITAPALVVAGREDASFPVSELEEMAAAIPGAELVVLDRIGHLAAYEDPATVARLVERLLGQDTGPA